MLLSPLTISYRFDVQLAAFLLAEVASKTDFPSALLYLSVHIVTYYSHDQFLIDVVFFYA